VVDADEGDKKTVDAEIHGDTQHPSQVELDHPREKTI